MGGLSVLTINQLEEEYKPDSKLEGRLFKSIIITIIEMLINAMIFLGP